MLMKTYVTLRPPENFADRRTRATPLLKLVGVQGRSIYHKRRKFHNTSAAFSRTKEGEGGVRLSRRGRGRFTPTPPSPEYKTHQKLFSTVQVLAYL